jgi:hypothetical protein
VPAIGWTVRKMGRGNRDLHFHVGKLCEMELSDKRCWGFSDGEWDHEGDDPFTSFVARGISGVVRASHALAK